jgi:nucleoside-diphosphate-sugar epimerase
VRIAITGSSGFIGTHLVKKLREQENDILEIDIKNGIDITNNEDIRKIDKFDCVIHLAAKIFVPDSFLYPELFFRVNYLGTLNILEMCRIYNARMIYASSYVYGNPNYLPIDEKHSLQAHNPYAQTKIIGEELCKSYNRDFKIPCSILRPFNIYGPGMNDNLLIPVIIGQAKNKKVQIKDSRPKRDFVYIDDLIDAYVLALQYNSEDIEFFNIAGGISYSVSDIFEMIKNKLRVNIEMEDMKEIRQNEILEIVGDINRAREILGWEPKINIENGISRMINYYNSLR